MPSVPEQELGAWLSELRKRLREASIASDAELLYHGPEPRRLVLRAEGPARAALSRVLRDPVVLSQLRQAPCLGGLEVGVRASADDSVTAFVAVVRDGNILLVSGSPGQGPEVPADSVEVWFEQLFRRPFPLEDSKGFRPIGPNLWTDARVERLEVHGFPHYLELRGLDSYRLLGHAGYGVNSYACYYTRVEPARSVRLRVGFGGVYQDPEESSLRVCARIAHADRVMNRAAALGCAVAIHDGMGSIRGNVGDICLDRRGWSWTNIDQALDAWESQ